MGGIEEAVSPYPTITLTLNPTSGTLGCAEIVGGRIWLLDSAKLEIATQVTALLALTLALASC